MFKYSPFKHEVFDYTLIFNIIKTLDFYFKNVIIFSMKTIKHIINSNCCSPVQSSKLTLNFFQVYVHLIIIKYYSIYILKNYSNSFLNLINFIWQKLFIHLNAYIDFYLTDIITQKVFYKIYFLILKKGETKLLKKYLYYS